MSPRADYGGPVHDSTGGRVASVAPGGPADRAGLACGDRIVAADGHPLGDVVDWQWYSDGDSVVAEFDRGGVKSRATLVRQPGEAWGIDFEAALFDGIHVCRNACAFCFMTQLPRGLRPSLYVRDDDYRLSFIQGNFISLTNLTDDDTARILEQHLSPLYVSLHAVSPAVRETLVCARDDRALERIDELLEGGIDLHVQIVLVPGVNDREELDLSLTWLAEREGIASVGVVPLGFTGHQKRFSQSYDGPEDAAQVIDQITEWHDAARRQWDTGWVYLADEFYLLAGRDLPSSEDYDGFPQYENGIGLARTFVDALARHRRRLVRAVEALEAEAATVVLVTGELFAPLLAGVLSAAARLSEGSGTSAHSPVRVLAVPNRFFGGNVHVTGLLTGEDILASIGSDAAVRQAEGGDGRVTYLVPDVILNADGLTLDDMAGPALVAASGRDVRLVSSDALGLVESLSRVGQDNRRRFE